MRKEERIEENEDSRGDDHVNDDIASNNSDEAEGTNIYETDVVD